jgi:SAM-dependent methyltransferase
MKPSPPSDPTVAYYEAHAEAFVRDTIGVDMTPLYEPFLALLPPGGHILDAGCGSGRDARAFKQLGYAVTAFDASPALARLASLLIGQPVEVLRLQELEHEAMFDGVWACASLLHVPRAELGGVLGRFNRSLRPSGVVYLSVKEGDGDEVRDSRAFTNFSVNSLTKALAGQTSMQVLNVWRTFDQRPDRGQETWVNALVRKPADGLPEQGSEG